MALTSARYTNTATASGIIGINTGYIWIKMMRHDFCHERNNCRRMVSVHPSGSVFFSSDALNRVGSNRAPVALRHKVNKCNVCMYVMYVCI